MENVFGGMGYTNCQYGFGVGNAGGMGAAGFGGVFTMTTTQPAMMVAPGEGTQAPMMGLELHTFAEPAMTREQELAEMMAVMEVK